MNKWVAVFGACALGWSSMSTAQLSDVGRILQEAGAPQTIVNSGDAIRRTCLELGAAGPQSGARADLFNRCREMSGTVLQLAGLPAGNTYGFSNPLDAVNAIRQFAGEETSSQTRLATESTNRQFANLGARMDAIRRGARSSGGPLALNLQGMDLGAALAGNTTTPAAGGLGASADRDADTGWGWFANGAVGWGDRSESVNESGYDFDSYGVTLGVDYAFDTGLTLGAAVGYAKYDTDFDTSPAASLVGPSAGGGLDSDGYSFSGFFVYNLERFYVNGIASYGRSDFDLERRIRFNAGSAATGTAVGLELDRTLTGETRSTQYGGQFTGGVMFGTGATTMDLYAGFDYLDIKINSYDELETGGPAEAGLALSYASQSTDSLQSIVGIMVRHAAATGFGTVIPYAGVEWRREYENKARDVEYSYVFAQPGSTVRFLSPTDAPDKSFFELTFGLSAQFANNLFGFVQYNRTEALSRTNANVITFGIRGVF